MKRPSRNPNPMPILLRLYAGRGKLLRYPSGQWSRGGNKFLRLGIGEQLRSSGLIALQAIRQDGSGVEVYDITDAGVKWLNERLTA